MYIKCQISNFSMGGMLYEEEERLVLGINSSGHLIPLRSVEHAKLLLLLSKYPSIRNLETFEDLSPELGVYDQIRTANFRHNTYYVPVPVTLPQRVGLPLILTDNIATINEDVQFIAAALFLL